MTQLFENSTIIKYETIDLVIKLSDTWGDGWNGANFVLSQNGIDLYTANSVDDNGIAFNSLWSNWTKTITIPKGSYELLAEGGPYDSEISYVIEDTAGNQIISGTATSGKIPVNFGTQNIISVGYYSDLNYWDTSSVTLMFAMFQNCSDFNQPLNSWDTSSVTLFSFMFNGCFNFNQPLNSWDTSSVTLFSHMFNGCQKFNQPLNSWDTSSSTNMDHMFDGCSNFNQNLNNWVISSVTDIGHMFDGCSKFNQPLNSWDTSSVTRLTGMFQNCSDFNQDLNHWDTSSVTTMHATFLNCHKFNGNISSWNTTNVTDMQHMFEGCKKFNQNISTKVQGTAPNQYLAWDVKNVVSMRKMLQVNPIYNEPLTEFNNGDKPGVSNSPLNWNTSKVTDMSNLFDKCRDYNQNCTTKYVTFMVNGQPVNYLSWDTSKVTTLERVFSYCELFNNGDNNDTGSMPLKWNTDSLTNLDWAFGINKTVTKHKLGGGIFNQPINTEEVSITNQFNNTVLTYTSFNIENVTSIGLLFYNNLKFNQPLNKWDTSSLMNGFYTFNGTINFNQNISINQVTRSDGSTYTAWDTSNMTDMAGILGRTKNFNNGDAPGESNSPLNWRTDSLLIMDYFLFNSSVFNQEIKKTAFVFGSQQFFTWDTSNVTSCISAFLGSVKFNQNVNSLDLSNVTDARSMFAQTQSFNNGDEHNKSSQPLTLTFSTNGCAITGFLFSASKFSQDISSVLNGNLTVKDDVLDGCNFGTNLDLLKNMLDLLNIKSYINTYIMEDLVDKTKLQTLINNGYNINLNIMDKLYINLLENKKSDNFNYINFKNGSHTLGQNEYLNLLDDQDIGYTDISSGSKSFTIKHNGSNKPILVKGYIQFSVPLKFEVVNQDGSTGVIDKNFGHIELLSYGDITISYIKDSRYNYALNFGFDLRISYFPNVNYSDIYPLINSELSGITFGDPHIVALNGQIYELPKNPGNYRMLQGKDLIVNTSTRKINSEEIKEIYRLEQKIKRALISDGCYYEKLFIKSDGHTLKYNFDTKKIECSSNLYFRANNNIISFINKKHGLIKLKIPQNNNIMMKNGFSLNIKGNNFISGLLVREYSIDSMKVDNIKDESYKIPIVSKNPLISTIFNPNRL